MADLDRILLHCDFGTNKVRSVLLTSAHDWR
jgi:hypothetical protein